MNKVTFLPVASALVKALALVLALAMIVSLINGCSRDKTGTGDSGLDAVPGTDDEIVELVMQYPTTGSTPQDLKLVQDAVNARTVPEIGVRITFYPVSTTELSLSANMMLSLGEQLDIVMLGLGNANLGEYVNKGILAVLDALVDEYGQSIVEAEGIAMSGGYFGGKLYALPSVGKLGRVRALLCRRDILDKYAIAVIPDHIYSTKELGEIFSVVKAGERDGFYCLALGLNGNVFYSNFNIFDRLGSSLASGCLMNYGYDTTEIVNYYATDEFEQICRTIREWYLSGYLNPECNTIVDIPSSQMQSGDYFSFFDNAEPDMIASLNMLMRGHMDTGLVPLFTSYPYAVTQNFRVSMCSITSSCAYPVHAMRWLNMLWSDEGICNLLAYGIEGQHYEFVADSSRVIRYPDDAPPSVSSYESVLSVWGNKSKLYIVEPLDETYYEALDDFNNSILPEHTSGALGYCFDFSPVRDQYSAVSEVIGTYERSLRLGILDLDAALPDFLAALEAAGIDEVIAENQRQFDSWKAAQ